MEKTIEFEIHTLLPGVEADEDACFGRLEKALKDQRHVCKAHLERGHGDMVVFENAALPAGREDIAHEMIHHLETGEPLHDTLEMGFNLKAMAILDAGIRSAASGKLELVNNDTWAIG